ncbi:heme-binding protein [Melittangium boletus]|uniref:heme-binding protein n=1 Tax=Melittangium boletus TaxID=83453 RepID=UPI003DA61B07
MNAKNYSIRAGAPQAKQTHHFGLLSELAGTWVGRGFNLISKPGLAVDKPFVLQVNSTFETLTFDPINAPIPNRGSVGPDLTIFGLGYEQRVTDAKTNGLLHTERGMWINVTPDGSDAQQITRLSTIPHGDSLLAQGSALRAPGGPLIAPISAVPLDAHSGQPLGLGYFPPDPLAFPQVNPFPMPSAFHLSNPNAALEKALEGQDITHTVVLEVSTDAEPKTFPPDLPGPYGGGILNIPFVTRNANATSLQAKFWIETVTPKDGPAFLQLQYSQRVMLVFPDKAKGGTLIIWPHISVATLVKV